MDSTFFCNDIGPLLSACIAEIVVKCPRDPIEYMGHWLRRHAANVATAAQYTDEMLEWTRQKTDYEHNKEIQRMLQAEIEQLNSCSMEIKSSVTKKPDLAHEQTHEDDDDAAKSATGGFEEDDDDGGVVAEAYVQLGSYHSAKNLKLVVDEQNADDRHSTNDDAGEDAA